MEWSTLELKVISCNDLKAFNFFHKLSVYAVVSIIDGELKKKEQQQKCMQRQKTPIDRNGGSNPEWNHVLQFNLRALANDYSHLFLSFDLQCEGVVYGNKTIGKVRVPLKDLIDEFNGALRFVRYQARGSDRKPNGVLNFSYKVNGKTIEKRGSASPEIKLSPKVNCSSEKVHCSTEKVHYPSLEDDEEPQDICYHTLDYVQVQSPLPGYCSPLPGYCSPLPGYCSPSPGYCSPLPKYEYKAAEVNGMTPPVVLPAQVPPLMVSNGSYCHPYPSPFAQTPEPWYMLESTGYVYNMPGGPGGGQFRRGDVETWRV